MSASTEPRWIVVETPCFPRKYKVVQEGRHDGNGSSSNNSWTEYFCHHSEAATEAYERNRVWPTMLKVLVELFANDRGVYEDQLLRWLVVRRDYPFDNTPEPECPGHLAQAREEIMREFRRELIAQKVGSL